jgi:hypothetical protein
MTLGPVQILVVGFEGGELRGEILEELRRLREHDIVRLLDVLLVAKDDLGNVRALEASELPRDEAERFGEVTRALIEGAGAMRETAGRAAGLSEEEAWDVADVVPNGSTAAIALLEHRWAIPLREAITRAGGTPLADAWVHRDDLAAIGLEEPAGAGTSASSGTPQP